MIDALWDNYMAFVTFVVFFTGAMGLASRSMAVSSMGAYLVFVYIAVETGEPLFENIMYVTLVLIFVGMSFKLWRLEGGGDI